VDERCAGNCLRNVRFSASDASCRMSASGRKETLRRTAFDSVRPPPAAVSERTPVHHLGLPDERTAVLEPAAQAEARGARGKLRIGHVEFQ